MTFENQVKMDLPFEIWCLIISWLAPNESALLIQAFFPVIQLNLLQWYFQQKHTYQEILIFKSKFSLDFNPRINRQIKAGTIQYVEIPLLHPKQIRELHPGDQLVFRHKYKPSKNDTGLYRDLFTKKRSRGWYNDLDMNRQWHDMRLIMDYDQPSNLSGEQLEELKKYFLKPLVNKILITETISRGLSGDHYYLKMRLRILPPNSFPYVEGITEIYCHSSEVLYPEEEFGGYFQYELQFSDHQDYESAYPGIAIFNSENRFIGYGARFGPGEFVENNSPHNTGLDYRSISIIKTL
jgi:hypothetical protein